MVQLQACGFELLNANFMIQTKAERVEGILGVRFTPPSTLMTCSDIDPGKFGHPICVTTQFNLYRRNCIRKYHVEQTSPGLDRSGEVMKCLRGALPKYMLVLDNHPNAEGNSFELSSYYNGCKNSGEPLRVVGKKKKKRKKSGMHHIHQ